MEVGIAVAGATMSSSFAAGAETGCFTAGESCGTGVSTGYPTTGAFSAIAVGTGVRRSVSNIVLAGVGLSTVGTAAPTHNNLLSP